MNNKRGAPKTADPLRDNILAYIQSFIVEKGYSPAVRDLADEFNKSTSVIHYHLTILEEENRIARAEGIARSIHVL